MCLYIKKQSCQVKNVRRLFEISKVKLLVRNIEKHHVTKKQCDCVYFCNRNNLEIHSFLKNCLLFLVYNKNFYQNLLKVDTFITQPHLNRNRNNLWFCIYFLFMKLSEELTNIRISFFLFWVNFIFQFFLSYNLSECIKIMIKIHTQLFNVGPT